MFANANGVRHVVVDLDRQGNRAFRVRPHGQPGRRMLPVHSCRSRCCLDLGVCRFASTRIASRGRDRVRAIDREEKSRYAHDRVARRCKRRDCDYGIRRKKYPQRQSTRLAVASNRDDNNRVRIESHNVRDPRELFSARPLADQPVHSIRDRGPSGGGARSRGTVYPSNAESSRRIAPLTFRRNKATREEFHLSLILIRRAQKLRFRAIDGYDLVGARGPRWGLIDEACALQAGTLGRFGRGRSPQRPRAVKPADARTPCAVSWCPRRPRWTRGSHALQS
jgi:hypothetical protein